MKIFKQLSKQWERKKIQPSGCICYLSGDIWEGLAASEWSSEQEVAQCLHRERSDFNTYTHARMHTHTRMYTQSVPHLLSHWPFTHGKLLHPKVRISQPRSLEASRPKPIEVKTPSVYRFHMHSFLRLLSRPRQEQIYLIGKPAVSQVSTQNNF